jgi:hypothetical protein
MTTDRELLARLAAHGWVPIATKPKPPVKKPSIAVPVVPAQITLFATATGGPA